MSSNASGARALACAERRPIRSGECHDNPSSVDRVRRGRATGVSLAQPAFAAPPSPADPAGIVTAIYTRAAKGKGDGGGAFIIENKAAKAKYLSKSLVALWAKADAHTPKGDVGPIDFDPVTNSQEPDVKSFTVATENQEADKATHRRHDRRAAMRRRASRRPDRSATISFATAPQWKIDDIKGASRRRAVVDPGHADGIAEELTGKT